DKMHCGHNTLLTLVLVSIFAVQWCYAGSGTVYRPCVNICKSHRVVNCRGICRIKKGHEVIAQCWTDCIKLTVKTHRVKFEIEPCMAKCQKEKQREETSLCPDRSDPRYGSGNPPPQCCIDGIFHKTLPLNRYLCTYARDGKTLEKACPRGQNFVIHSYRICRCEKPPRSTPPPKVCRWSVWSSWLAGRCSVTCDVGTRSETRTRTKEHVRGPAIGDGCFGNSIEQRDGIRCSYSPCPTPPPVCRWSVWSSWLAGRCSATCGVGTRSETRTRTKEYVRGPAIGDGCFGSSTEQRYGIRCSNPPCQSDPPVCRWSEWNRWQVKRCSVTCGQGTRAKYRTRTKQFGPFGVSNCRGMSQQYDNEICGSGTCARRVCIWSDWTRWRQGGCSATCGVGSRTETRTRSKLYGNSESGEGVVECIGNNIQQKTISCRNDVCKSRVCRWSSWSSWEQGACSVTCGQGMQSNTRWRSKTYTYEQYGQPECLGDGIERRNVACNMQPCPTPTVCRWSVWSSWLAGRCSVTCDVGTRSETRTRTKEIVRGPAIGGGCFGSSIEQRDGVQCRNSACPVPTPVCRWSVWSSWLAGRCSVTCDVGTRSETRTRTKEYLRAPAIGDGCFGSNIQERGGIQCHNQACPVPTPSCVWGAWGNWIKETNCVFNGSPMTHTCFQPGTARFIRRRQCHCRGKRTGGGTTHITQCRGNAAEHTERPCCAVVVQPAPPVVVQPPQIGCFWGAFGNWNMETTCMPNGLPRTNTCLQPGTARFVRTRQCHCRGKRTGGGIAHTTQCVGNPVERTNRPCCARIGCSWGAFGNWIKETNCVPNGLPRTNTCFQPGTARFVRTRQCHCRGKRTGGGIAHTTQCVGNPVERTNRPCCAVVIQPVPPVVVVPPQIGCFWGAFGNWIMETKCVFNGAPRTNTCLQPGTARFIRTRQCHCRGKRTGGGIAHTTQCGGNPLIERIVKVCCVVVGVGHPQPGLPVRPIHPIGKPATPVWGPWVEVTCNAPAGCTVIDPLKRSVESRLGSISIDKRLVVCEMTNYKCTLQRECQGVGCVGPVTQTENRLACCPDKTPPTPKTPAPPKPTPAKPTPKKPPPVKEKCPTGYTLLSKECLTCGQVTGCVKVYSAPLLDWMAAEARCQQDGAHLFRWSLTNVCYDALKAHLQGTNNGLLWSCGTQTDDPAVMILYRFTCGNDFCPNEGWDSPQAPPPHAPSTSCVSCVKEVLHRRCSCCEDVNEGRNQT
ncbi:unnamed protein product, partial [Owenia fusiformis]